MTIFRHAYALSGSTLVSFNPATPSVGTSIPVSGLISAQILVGIDVRPTNGVLYGLGVNATGGDDGATLYTISPVTGVATIVGTHQTRASGRHGRHRLRPGRRPTGIGPNLSYAPGEDGSASAAGLRA